MARQATNKKKSAKAPEPAAPVRPSIRSRLFRPLPLCVLAGMSLFAVMAPAIRRTIPDLSDRPEYQLSLEKMAITPAPAWIPQDIVEQVFDRAELSARQSLQDDQLTERVAAAFHTHPWIERVVSVRKSWPPRLQVDVIYREPVAMVRGVDGFYPIDRNGILLPSQDFSPADVERYPVIERVASVPLGKLGEAWGDPAVTEAAQIASVLLEKKEGRSWWQRLELAGIQVPRHVAMLGDADEMEFQLRTQGGSEILWGRSPTSNHPGELTVAQKLQRLEDFQSHYGGLDDEHGPYQIDIRPWQGIQRGLIAREPQKNSLR
ncbi:MAG: hypothetical protein JNM43_08575 [Planctomycetaceae bacterium]|nr:hypothetical protein [Planctomycetaceae bacterium]